MEMREREREAYRSLIKERTLRVQGDFRISQETKRRRLKSRTSSDASGYIFDGVGDGITPAKGWKRWPTSAVGSAGCYTWGTSLSDSQSHMLVQAALAAHPG